jgi:hypothetical protein
MAELTPQDIVFWHKSQAAMHTRMAEEMERQYGLKAPQRFKRVEAEQQHQLLPIGTLTAEQLESRVRHKSARVSDIAREFSVTEEAVKQLLDPASKVYVGERGWLKVRE